MDGNDSCAIVSYIVQKVLMLLYSPQTVFVGGYTVFTVSVRPNESVSVTFCFLNIWKSH